MNKKKKRQLVFLLGFLLILVLVLVGIKLIPKEAQVSEEETESFSVFFTDTEAITEIGFSNENGSFHLKKTEAEWICLEDDSLMIDSEKVSSFLNVAVSATTDTKIEEVTDFSQYGLSEPSMQVVLQSSDNMYVIEFGDYNSLITRYYVRVNEENTVYTVERTYRTSMLKEPADFEAEEELEDELETEPETEPETEK